ncbi:MAG: penicillin-binding transpeptidase domain-containing protein [Myxococcales bacterium]
MRSARAVRSSPPARDASRYVRLRALVVAAALLAGFGVVLLRAAKVQLFDRARLSRLAREQTRREIEWAPRRGKIADRNGAPLAITQDVDSIFADPSAFTTRKERESAASAIARALRRDRADVLRRISQENRRFVWIQRRADEGQAARVAALGIDGIELVKEPKRFYPQRELAGHVLGFVGDEGGQEGLERELDASLRGKGASLPALRDARGAMVLAEGAPDPAALAGASVTLSIDTAIQLAAERELSKAVSQAHAAGGFAVVVDVENGDVLALASNPTFDANKPGRDPLRWRNRAVQDQLEPGSTIKSFVLSAALDRGAISQTETFFCEGGVWAHNGHHIHDTHKVFWATPVTVLSESSNICAAKIGETLGKERLVAALRAFGFGERTGIGLPGEGKGSLPDPARMPAIALDTISYGQGMSATGVQTAMAMAAIAGGGILLEPVLVKEIVGPDGTVLVRHGRKEIRRVIRPETARAMTAMLVEVVEKGTGGKARIAGVRVAGKTGTAQKVDPVRGGYGDGRLASFLGFVPADAPKLTVLVAVDEPEGDVFGGSVAAPAFAAIASEALRQIGISPARPREIVAARASPPARPASARTRPMPAPGQAVVPDLIGLSASSAEKRLRESALEAELRGSGRTVAQSPPAGVFVQRGARVLVTLAQVQ